jgi:hypothetical protein
MKKIPFLTVLSINLVLTGCVSMAPVSNSFESAKMLEKGQTEIMGNYSLAFLRWEDENNEKQTDQTNNNIGLRIGYGISRKIDLKIRYERLIAVTEGDKLVFNGINYFGLSPRYSIVENMLSGGVDLSLYTYKVKQTEDMEAYSDSDFAISPGLALTFPKDRNFDVTVATKFDFFTGQDVNLWHLNLGFGISSDPSVWEIRPEVGLIKDLDDFSSYSWFSGGLALILKFSPSAK